jgi:hypothetical protein
MQVIFIPPLLAALPKHPVSASNGGGEEKLRKFDYAA